MRNNLLNIKNFSIEVNGQKLIDDLKLSIKAGDKLGLIGCEGNGKSLLMKAVVRNELGGGINFTGTLDTSGMVGYVSQELSDRDKQMLPRDYLISGDWSKLNDIGRWDKVFRVLGLDVNWLERDSRMRQCSGGEQVKLRLAKALFDKPDLLLLDEPTNYLDIDSLRRLEKFCGDFVGGLMVISHDEVFLEKVTNRILHLERLSKRQKNVWRLENVGFVEYQSMRIGQFERDTNESARQRRKHNEQMKKLKEIKHNVMMNQITIVDCNARRLLNKKMKSILAQQAKLDSRDLLKKPDKEKEISFWFDEKPANQSKVWLDWREELVKMPIGELFIEKLRVTGSDKIFVVGPNGSGKTWLLKYIWQKLREGNFEFGYLSQDASEKLPMNKLVIDWLSDFNKNENMKTMLGALNFGREEMEKKIGQLSSGQRMKLIFLGLKLKNPDILLLDEPMSNLSMSARQELRQAIKNFSGAAIIVSHDRRFINEVADVAYQIKGGCLQEFNSWNIG